MADHGFGTKHFATVDHVAGLEPVQSSGLESVPPGWGPSPRPQAQTIHHWQQQQQQQHDQQTYTPGGYYTETSQKVHAPDEDGPQRRILGLSVRAFWVALFILVVILAAGIGGGIAGGMAARSRAAESASPTVASEAGIPASVSSSPSKGPTTDPTPTPTDTSPTTTTTSSSSKAANPTTSSAPTDGGCPNINGTAYTPLDASGRAITLQSSGQAQSFRRLCNINYPSGARYGNPGIHDIVKLWLPSLEDCIAACAAYNVNYEVNVAAGVYENGGGGLCRSVAVVKREGEYCYLKNGTGKDDTFGRPRDYSSAVLILDD